MMTEYYGMTRNPFDKEGTAPGDAFESVDHGQMLQRLAFLIAVGGLGVFTAQPGMGKTFALRTFLAGLNPALYTTAYVNLTTVGIREFYCVLCEALGLDTDGRRSTLFSRIHTHIATLMDEARRPLILAVDEAQHLQPKILDDLKLLMNFDCDARNCFSLILLGEPSLLHLLSRPSLEALRQRITVHYNYAGMTPEETASYIRHKLDSAGASPSVVTPAAAKTVHSLGGGNPRLIDRLMTQALRLGAQHHKDVLDDEILMAADASLALQ